MCAQRRLRSAYASTAHADQSRLEALDPWLPTENTAEAMTRLSGYAVSNPVSTCLQSCMYFASAHMQEIPHTLCEI